VVADGPCDGLDDHGQDKAKEGQRAQVGVLQLLRHEIQQDGRQDDRVQAVPHEGQAEPVCIDVEVVNGVQFSHVGLTV